MNQTSFYESDIQVEAIKMNFQVKLLITLCKDVLTFRSLKRNLRV